MLFNSKGSRRVDYSKNTSIDGSVKVTYLEMGIKSREYKLSMVLQRGHDMHTGAA